jgi:hypothetical protein
MTLAEVKKAITTGQDCWWRDTDINDKPSTTLDRLQAEIEWHQRLGKTVRFEPRRPPAGGDGLQH